MAFFKHFGKHQERSQEPAQADETSAPGATSSDTPEERADEAASERPAEPGPDAEEAEETAEAESAPAERGPYDASQVGSIGSRLDLGAVWIPSAPGLEVRLSIDKSSQRVTGVTCAIGGSAVEIEAFAAPRTLGIWEEIRGEIVEAARRSGGGAAQSDGPFGRELLVELPVGGQQGSSAARRQIRFVGVDGPRWFLRGVFTGPAAAGGERARALEALFSDIVVRRDVAARPPREPLELHVPKGPPSAGESGEAPAPAPDEDPLRPGPTITETR